MQASASNTYRSVKKEWIHSLLAMTAEETTHDPGGAMRPSCAFNFRPIEGVGNDGCRLHPQPRLRIVR